ncbi:MAG: PfkB family carbohydrate kinase [Pseudomonadota bacterium]|nr:PfkB family carbohydrate kinase [Pseudomonadota bacterium]
MIPIIFDTATGRAATRLMPGDCFSSALATALVAGAELTEAVVFACQAAAMFTTKPGAQSSMPRR